MSEQEKQQEIKELYYQSNFDGCIKSVDEECSSQDISITHYQTLQLYKGLSLLEMSRLKEGHECMDNLMKESQIKKGSRVDEIDLIIQILYQQQQFDRDDYLAEQRNIILLKVLNQYKEQNEQKPDYDEGIFFFGQSIHMFIDSFRNQNDLKCIELLKQSYSTTKKYEQEILNFIGWMYDYKQQFENSIDWCQKLFKLNPAYPGIANNLALLYKYQNEMEKSLEYFKIAELYGQSNTIILTNIGLYYESVEDNENAELYYKKSIDIDISQGNSWLRYAQFLFSQNRIDDAENILLEGVKNDPSHCQLYLQLYEIEQQRMNDDKCTEYLLKCIEHNPENGFYFFKLGSHYCNNVQNYEESLNYLNKALDHKLNESVAHQANLLIGTCYFRQNLHLKSLVKFLEMLNNNQFSSSTRLEIFNIDFIVRSSNQFTYADVVKILENTKGCIQMKYDVMAREIFHPRIQLQLQILQQQYRQLLSIIQYQKLVSPFITFQSQVSHWDLFID